MERIVHESRFAIARFDDSKALYTLTYLEETERMFDEDWKSLMRELYTVTDKLKPVYILDDNSERKYFYSSEVQQWTLELFLDSWSRNGLKKYVQILPRQLIGQLSGEQIVELAQYSFSDLFENTAVTSYEAAMEWLGI